MKKSYHLSKVDLEKIIADYFSNKGETVTSCDFKVQEYGGDWNHYKTYSFSEAVVYVEDSNTKKENNGTKSKECAAGS